MNEVNTDSPAVSSKSDLKEALEIQKLQAEIRILNRWQTNHLPFFTFCLSALAFFAAGASAYRLIVSNDLSIRNQILETRNDTLIAQNKVLADSSRVIEQNARYSLKGLSIMDSILKNKSTNFTETQKKAYEVVLENVELKVELDRLRQRISLLTGGLSASTLPTTGSAGTSGYGSMFVVPAGQSISEFLQDTSKWRSLGLYDSMPPKK